MIHVSRVGKVFRRGKITALKNVSFTVREGEILGVLGENGAGKTTLLRILSGILNPSEGSVRIEGTGMLNTFSVPERKKIIGLLPGSDPGLYDHLTGRENITYFARLHGIPEQQVNRSIDQLADILELSPYLDRKTGSYSRGMKQKTAIARTLIHDPPVLILDEPSSGLDYAGTVKLHDFIKLCRLSGKTVILSSHHASEVEALCDRVLCLREGQVHALVEREVFLNSGGDFFREIFLSKSTFTTAEVSLDDC